MEKDPFARCLEIAAHNRSPLFQVSRLFPLEKGRLFLASYAAMRLVDDLVDEQFSAHSRQDDHQAKVVRAQVELWQQQACAAADGRFQNVEGAYEPLVFVALNQSAGRSNLGDWPWNALAASMKADIERRPMETWDDFLAYCEGATVAPATVFVYILASRFQNNGFNTPEPLSFYRDKVRDMAVFCYLMHILRDLARDVARSNQLVTIPNDILRRAGLNKTLLGQWITEDPHRILPLQRLLLEKAGECRERGTEQLMKNVSLPVLERQILKKLVGHYVDLYHEMTSTFAEHASR
ncbi:MAG TPA: squalene/phytoene synthase family protein [Magnetococcales bacterium]|nr:squalene/phytoene synthase family protein [Magnetococcales bacterium]